MRSPCRKIGPQTGIVVEPCAGTLGPALIACMTLNEGNCPLLRAARVVRSAGGIFIAEAAGPSPLAETPWQVAQYCKNICLLRSAEAGLPGVRCAGGCCPIACMEKSVARIAAKVLMFRIVAPRLALCWPFSKSNLKTGT